MSFFRPYSLKVYVLHVLHDPEQVGTQFRDLNLGGKNPETPKLVLKVVLRFLMSPNLVHANVAKDSNVETTNESMWRHRGQLQDKWSVVMHPGDGMDYHRTPLGTPY